MCPDGKKAGKKNVPRKTRITRRWGAGCRNGTECKMGLEYVQSGLYTCAKMAFWNQNGFWSL